ncbi:hypothetical protein, partial [Microcoleus sp. herbarium7]|uniref:hypothetical protein n=1 Tax=Microcoleus sp. herbarium7 TaxID=3055435 RepID=UPI002FD5BCFE
WYFGIKSLVLTNKLSAEMPEPFQNTRCTQFFSVEFQARGWLCIQLTSDTNVHQGIFRGGGRVYLTCLSHQNFLVNPPLQNYIPMIS